MDPAAPRIRPLPGMLVNQIAAGEVIERPLSVVKELLENSLDAGATRVTVGIAQGGIDSIVVSDDGHGIAGAELAGAFRRHWTSKLGSDSDLAAIASLGFRGEALASIASVADVSCITRSAGDAHAWRLDVAAGAEPGRPQPAQGTRGTRIAVSGLFHNVPARRRFLKQPRTEYLHVYRLLRQYAFARPQLRLEFETDAARGLRLAPAGDDLGEARWRRLFGRAFVTHARAVQYADDELAISGWVALPALDASQSELQYLSVNGRVIRDRQLAHAVRMAYGDALPPGRFPQYALRIDMAPPAVDVNVHPGKLEVRFAALREVHDRVYSAVRTALGSSVAAAPLPAMPATVAASGAAATRVAESAPPWRGRATPARPLAGAARASTPDLRPLALVAQRYGIVAEGDRTCVIDLVASWQRVLERRLALPVPQSRTLLLPARVAGRALSDSAALRRLGFVFERLSETGELLRAVPRVLPDVDEAELCRLLPDTCDAVSNEVDLGAIAAACAQALLARCHGLTAADLDALFQAAAAAEVDVGDALVVLTGAVLESVLGDRH